MKEPSFELSDVFENLVDWPKRLANEELFYRRLFERVGARSVLDTACGTGQHAALFHSWGLTTEGADLSSRMIEKARDAFGEPEGLRWVVRGYDQPVRLKKPFDVVMCVGNSLSLAPNHESLKKAVAEMTAAVRKGGAVLVHVLNLWRFPEGPCTWQKCLIADRPEGKAMIVKGVHRCGSQAYVELFLAPLSDPDSKKSTHLNLICIEAKELEEMFRDCGATAVELHGSYGAAPYQREKSVDIVMTVFM